MESESTTRRITVTTGLLAIGLAVMAGLGCGHPTEGPNLQSTIDAVDDPATGEVADGLFVWGHEVRSFRPCGSEDELWLIGPPEVMEPLVAEYRKLTDGPHQPVYVRFVGDVSGAPEDGFGADYDGVFGVREVVEIRRLAASDCP